MIQLGVNIDHVATVRNARGGIEPDPLTAAEMAALGGANSITVHLREDRRHIVDKDVRVLKERLTLPLNLEMSIAPEIVDIAMDVCPYQVTLVPEKREEKTTESGLDVIKNSKKIGLVAEMLRARGIVVSMFIDPEVTQLQAALKTGCRTVELHTGAFSKAGNHAEHQKELERLLKAGLWCQDNGVTLHAGHGLNYQNTYDILNLPKLKEVNIGHAIIARAIFVGLSEAVREMRNILNQATTHESVEKTK